MAPKKKNMPHNAFYFYMRSFKAENKATHSMTNNELAEAAAPYWERLPNCERAKYEKQAFDWKRSEQKTLEHKYTTTGVSYAELERQEKEQKDREKNMNLEIENTICELDHDTKLLTKEFYLIHVNFYCHTDIGTYIPCEVAVLEFTLKNGVQHLYETIINVDEVPLGYSFEAQKVSEETHQIPVPPHGYGERGYHVIFYKLRQLLQGHQKMRRVLPPLYTHSNVIPVVESFFKILIDNTDSPDDLFRVYPLSKLFFELRNACAQNAVFPVISVAERELDKDHFSFTQGISCEYHGTTDAKQFCSLSYVKRWTYTICDHCCQDVNINLVPGYHVPLFADTQHYLKYKAVREQSSYAASSPEEVRKPFSSLFKSEESDHGSKSSPAVREQPPRAVPTSKEVRKPFSAQFKSKEDCCHGSSPPLAVKEQPSCAASTSKEVRKSFSALFRTEESGRGSSPPLAVKEQPSCPTITAEEVRKPFSALFRTVGSVPGSSSPLAKNKRTIKSSRPSQQLYVAPSLRESHVRDNDLKPLQYTANLSKSDKETMPVHVPVISSKQKEYGQMPVELPVSPLKQNVMKRMPLFKPMSSSNIKENETNADYVSTSPSNKVEDDLKPLRRPRTRAIAMTKAFANPSFCENISLNFQDYDEPLVVAGRGKRLNH